MQELDFLKSILVQAGKIALKHHGKKPEYWEKPDGQGRVSVADLEVDNFLCEEIARAYPDDAILTEEREDSADRLNASRVWIVDPIDGTEAYLNGQDYFAISVALWVNGEIELGAVYAPKHDKMYAAIRGQGADLNGTPIQANKAQNVTQARFLASNARYNRAMINADPPLSHYFLPSIAYRLAMVAEGEFDATFALRPSWEWDLAAGTLIVNEAGAILTDRLGHIPKFNQMPPQIDGMIAGAEVLVQKLVKRIT